MFLSQYNEPQKSEKKKTKDSKIRGARFFLYIQFFSHGVHVAQ